MLDKYTAVADNTTDRWELVGASQSIPVHARTAVFEFTADGQGGTDDTYLDDAFFYVQPDTLRPDQGAYGNTDSGQSDNLAPHLASVRPTCTPTGSATRHWRSSGIRSAPSSTATVRIDLYQDGPNGPQFLTNITPSTPDTGEYTWTAGKSGIPFGTYGLRIEISLVGDPAVYDRSTENLHGPGEHHDLLRQRAAATRPAGSTPPPRATTATTAASQRPASVSSTTSLRTYSLGPGDTLYVDTGNYQLFSPILLISAVPGVSADQRLHPDRADRRRADAVFSLANALDRGSA